MIDIKDRFRTGIMTRDFLNDCIDYKFLCEEAAGHIEQQEAEIARLRKDAERLDWLDRQGFAYGFQDIHEGNRWEIYGGYMHLRDAIDCGIKCDTSTQSTDQQNVSINAANIDILKPGI